LRHYTIIITLLFISFISFGQFHEDVLPGQMGGTLINNLKAEFRPNTVLTYSNARKLMYRQIYNVDDSVTCVYSGHKLYLNPNSSNPIGDLIRNGAADGINCEHTFPQSKGAGSGNPRSDMHHLYPARARVNEARLNFPFGDIDDRQTDRWFKGNREQGSIPIVDIDAYSEQINGVFEPKEEHKGNVARAVFYFYTIYREVADAGFFSDQRTTLCNWHYQDPVDSLEWERNKIIAEVQDDKRNPFILDCTVASRAYCPDIEEKCDLTSIAEIDARYGNTKVLPNPSYGSFYLELGTYRGAYKYELINNTGRTIKSGSEHHRGSSSHIDSNLLQGSYHLWITLDDKQKSRQVFRLIVL